MMAYPAHRCCKIIQANLHHSTTATAQMRKWLEVNATAIALIQEPWVRNGAICGLRNAGGKLIAHTGPENTRACIYITKNIHAQSLTSFCSRDLCAIKLHRAQDHSLPEMVIASAYMPEADAPPPHDMTRLISILRRIRTATHHWHGL